MLMVLEVTYTHRPLEDDLVLLDHLVEGMMSRGLVPRKYDQLTMEMIFTDMVRLLPDGSNFAVYTRGKDTKRPARDISVLWIVNLEELLG